MTDKIDEILSGLQAGKDINLDNIRVNSPVTNQFFVLNKPDIIFNQTKFSHVLDAFLKRDYNLENEVINNENFKRNMPLKNELNNVNMNYYKGVIESELQQHFDDITIFLQNPRNENFLKKYVRIAKDLTDNYAANEEYFKNLINHMKFVKEKMLKKMGEELEDDLEDYITIFLNHMYFFCEYGIKIKGERNDNSK